MTGWSRIMEWPLTAAAVAFLVAYALPILDTGLDAGQARVCDDVQWATWALFALDFVVRLLVAPRKLDFLRRNVVDLAVVALPVLRPLRLLRLITLLTVLNRRAAASLRGRVAAYVLGGSVLLGFLASLTMLKAERDAPGATITSFGDALWWAITTMSTVGYGDSYPVTTTGRCIAAALMVCGIALLGVVTATLASWFVDSVREAAEEGVDVETATLREEIAALSLAVERLSARLPDTPPAGAGESPDQGRQRGPEGVSW